jgi:cytochrome c-type biogenesis protein
MLFQSPHLLTAFVAGLLSFLTPCVLPLVPGYLSFISGQSLLEMSSRETRKKVLGPVIKSSLSFILGFSVVFVTLGALATTLGQHLAAHKDLLGPIGGVIIIVLGLHMAGVFHIGFLHREARFQGAPQAHGAVRAFLLGLAFAFGWTPCVGPILGGILTLAVREDTVRQGIFLLVAYSLGMGVPFFLTGLAVDRFFTFFDRFKHHFRKVEIAAGALLIVIGIFMIVGEFNTLKVFFDRIVPESFSRWG